MARLRIFLFASVLCSLAVYGQGGITTVEPVIIPVPHSSAATAEVPSSSKEPLVPSPVPSSPVPVETTPAPETTTSTTAKTTTTTTTTTTPAPTTTTPAPTTTTPPPPAPTPAPTPAPGPTPPPEQGKWNYTSDANVTCILVEFAAQFNVTYNKKMDNSTELVSVLVNVPKNASVLDGSCNATGAQWLQLSWPTNENNLTLHFQLNETTNTYTLSQFVVSFDIALFPNSSLTKPLVLTHGAEWSTPRAASYRCAAATRLPLTESSQHDPNLTAMLTLTQLQEEAYRTAHTSTFSAARDCGGNDVPDAVPIAVGCALGGLVVVVLVAYLVGRRRSAARGYLSM